MADLDNLKSQWLIDPCWDIEHSDGFEEHYEELKAWRLQKEAEWKAANIRRLQEFADNLGIGNNLALAAYIKSLQDRIAVLERAAQQ